MENPMDELETLNKQIAELTKKAETLASERKSSVIVELLDKIELYGITAQDLHLNLRSAALGSKVPLKFRKGTNAWSGRGRQPQWIISHLQNGGSITDLEIKRKSAA
jgi:DNA-binding protein H-NS